VSLAFAMRERVAASGLAMIWVRFYPGGVGGEGGGDGKCRIMNMRGSGFIVWRHC